MTNIITLLTDFGIDDEYVGVMKGVILSINPDAKIIDITHRIDPQDMIQAAYAIDSAYEYFPEGTVHVVVVDPGVGSDRSILAVRTEKYVFLAPDNGVLTLALNHENISGTETAEVIRVDNSAYPFLQDGYKTGLNSVSQTFHGRDIFAPVAAHVSKGVEISRLGMPAEQNELTRLDIPRPYISDDELFGKIVWPDSFGNLMTNIDMKSLEAFCKGEIKKRLEIHIEKYKIRGLSESYASVKSGEPLAIMGSRGYLEISVNCGNAGVYFMAGKGDDIRISKVSAD